VTRPRDGYALVTGLRPFQQNVVTIRPESLPMDAEIKSLRLTLTLSRRSAALARFPVRPARGALLKVVLEDGTPLPAGATMTVDGGNEEFPVALRGEAYLKGLSSRNAAQANWKGQSCRIEFELPKGSAPLPVLGPLVCRGVRP
jgi:outer membrane usher protein